MISQVALAARLGVGRTPLREALRMLQRERLVDAEYNRRIRIAPLTTEELEQLYALRILQETLAIRLSVPYLTDDELAELERLLIQMDRLSDGEFEVWEQPHRAFHQLLIAHAGQRVRASTDELQDHTERYRRALILQHPIALTLGAADHTRIVAACNDRDEIAAGDTLARHLGRTALSLISISDPLHDPVTVRAALRVAIADGAGVAPHEQR